ncbi:FCS-Like Zinc finger 8-like [Zingiber officinale]|nr:FCS-Like Zinc finger 8-like [Zingiber officinale]XP_042462813.1 FCS-Like Zinc finger 8-like [Zingiber officinale]
MPRRSTSDTEAAAVSPTSILDSKPFSAFRNPFFFGKDKHLSRRKGVPMKTAGLGLLDALTIDEVSGKNSSMQDHRKVVFGSQLKVQIPPPVEFDISSRNSQMPPNVSGEPVFVGSEIELSEEYTCVISHRPDLKTTHFFDDCIVENRSDGFLSFCYGCKKKLGPGMDVYIYRDKSFCSNECRCQAMLSDEDGEEGEEKF